MGPTSASDRLTARLPLRAVAGLIPFGLLNRFKMAGTDFARLGFPGSARPFWLKPSLILLTAGFGCLPLVGATNTNTAAFETPPPEPRSLQWDANHRLTRERQERYRKRVSIPAAVGVDVPKSATASMINGLKMVAAPKPAPPVSSGIALQMLYFAVALILSGFLVLRRYAPHVLVDLNRRYNPWALAPAGGWTPSARVRAEEQAFGEFLAAFRIGPVTRLPPELPQPETLLSEFYARAKRHLVTQRKLLHDIGREAGDPARLEMLTDLDFELALLKDEAGFPETLPVWQVASALEGLLNQLTGNVINATPSTLRTVAGGVDLLDDLCVPGLPPDLLTDRPLRFLVVDDDKISCRALSLSLEKAFSQPDLAPDGETALALATAQAYDVIFLDVQMPGMDGFELCTKIRDTLLNQATPVVFVTIQSDFDARCKSTLSGGNDLMGKPFLTFEITVKALTLALHGRLNGHARKPLSKPEAGRHTADSLVVVTEGPRPVPGPVPAPRPSPSTPSRKPDRVTNAFLARVSKQLGPLRDLCQPLLQKLDNETRQILIVDGFLRMNSLISKPAPEVTHPAYQVSAALEGLFRKMLEHSQHATPSALATVAAAVDLLNDLCVPGIKLDLAIHPPIDILVVDDDLVARRSLVGALQTAFKKPQSAENGEAALARAREQQFDVIFLDVVMPGMDGFEVCSKIRETVPNRATPVVFVTGQRDFDARAQMSRNGGDDLMGKPFLTAEITVKALTFALRGRLHQFEMQPGS